MAALVQIMAWATVWGYPENMLEKKGECYYSGSKGYSTIMGSEPQKSAECFIDMEDYFVGEYNTLRVKSQGQYSAGTDDATVCKSNEEVRFWGKPGNVTVGVTCASGYGTDVYYDVKVLRGKYRQIIVGAGPGGMAAAHLLEGSIVLERGSRLDKKFYEDLPPYYTHFYCDNNMAQLVGNQTCAEKMLVEDGVYEDPMGGIVGGKAITYSRVGGQQSYNGLVYAPLKDEWPERCAARLVEWNRLNATWQRGGGVDRGITAACDGSGCSWGDDLGSNVRRRTVAYEVERGVTLDVRENTNVVNVLVEEGSVVGVKTDGGDLRADRVLLAGGAVGNARLLCNMGIQPAEMHNHFFLYWSSSGEMAKSGKDMWFENFVVSFGGCPDQEFEMHLVGKKDNLASMVLMQMTPKTRFAVECGGNNVVLRANENDCDVVMRQMAVEETEKRNKDRTPEDWTQLAGKWQQAYHWGGGWPETVPEGLAGTGSSTVKEPGNCHMSMPAAAEGVRQAAAWMGERQAAEKCGVEIGDGIKPGNTTSDAATVATTMMGGGGSKSSDVGLVVGLGVAAGLVTAIIAAVVYRRCKTGGAETIDKSTEYNLL